MFYWELLFLISALAAAMLGFGGLAAGCTAEIAVMLCTLFVLLFVVSLLGERWSHRSLF